MIGQMHARRKGKGFRIGPTANFKGTSRSKKPFYPSLSNALPVRRDKKAVFLSNLDLPNGGTDVDGDEIHVDFNDTSRKTKTQHDNLAEWVEKVYEYRDALFGFESIEADMLCGCKRGIQASYKCLTCSLPSHYCRDCIIARHSTDPFHRIVKWNGTYFEGVSLSSLGISITTGHSDGSLCHSRRSRGSFTAIHINGFHNVEIFECQCDNSTSFDLKLFSSQLFSATITSPKTVMTFAVLEQFRVLHLEGKISSYTFIQGLIRLTSDDYVGAWLIKDRAREFQRVARQWIYLHELKRSPPNLSQSLATKCPACPLPGINMKPDWIEKTPEDKHWLGRQFMHHDANFRLVREATSKQTNREPGLWEGKGFFVENSKYSTYLKSAGGDQQQKSTCSNLRAVSSGNRSRFGSLEITGIAGAVCRHGCAIPGSFVNLYKGERYVNSDYALSNAMKNMKNLKEIVLSYDIACQYSKNFVSRFTNSAFLELPNAKIHFLIPKFHLPGHKDGCRYQYSFNYMKGVGRSDGEGIERFWSPHNHLSSSTSKMTDGFRSDTLESNFQDWNQRKARKMALDLGTRLTKAREQLLVRSTHYQDLCLSLDKRLVKTWLESEKNFAFGAGKADIYAPAADKSPSKGTVLSTLLELERPGERRDISRASAHNSQVVLWINEGLELEDIQWSIKTRRSKVNTGSMDRDHVLLHRDRNSLWNKIVEWRNRSPTEVNTSGLLGLDVPPLHPEEELIPLPSSLSVEERPSEFASIEALLREGQANDALRAIRACLSQRLAVIRDKNRNAKGQWSNSRARDVIERFNAQLDQIAAQYKHAYEAMLRLGMDNSNNTYRELKQSDLNTSHAFDIERALGVGYEEPISWLWLNSGALNAESLDDNWLVEVNRVQFLDAKVNYDRWNEEVELLETELDRTKEYFEHFAGVWRSDTSDGSTAGYKAYCARMAAMYDQFAKEVDQYTSNKMSR